MRTWRVSIVVLAAVAVLGQAASGPLIIFHAGSLTVPLEKLAQAFQELHPQVSFAPEASGSLAAIRKITELGREADLVFSADWVALERLLIPEYAGFAIQFARNEMVIAYTARSLYSDEITSDNWYRVLLRDDVIYGHSDPDLDPCGYRTLLVWQLAERFYGVPGLYQKLRSHCPPANVRPKSVELIALLQTGNMDYAFEYRSVAKQHGLEFVELPPEINLGWPKYAAYYAQAQVEIAGKAPGERLQVHGAPIVYGFTIPYSAPHPELAVEFAAFVLSPRGREILTSCGQPPLVPAGVSQGWDKLPPALRSLVVPSSRE